MKDLHNIKKDFEKIVSKVHEMEDYSFQEEILQNFVHNHPENTSINAVELKVKLLNLFYSTYISATNQMAKHICSLKIDKALKNGDKTIVEKIARLNLANDKVRDNYSFATKYCALHQPDKYPIFDSVVCDTFLILLTEGYLAPQYNYAIHPKKSEEYSKSTFKKNVLRNYLEYCKFYDCFREKCGIIDKNIRNVDWYIWGAFKLDKIDSELEKIAQVTSI